MILPFGLLLAMIALAPLRCPAWWVRNYPKVAYSLGAVTLAYYLFSLRAYGHVLHTAKDYISFIALIGSLFVVSGGIHIRVKGEATPWVNTVYLFIGAVISNLLGTTGASMLLIRPWLRMNKYRITAHHVVFFIFIVSNVGGCLTPIGDPPLFLGYLIGVPFWWVAAACWPMWLFGVCYMLAIFYWIDRRNYLRAPEKVREAVAEPHDEWHFEGLHNLIYLAMILGAVFINNPPFLREGIMAVASVLSYFTTKKPVHEANEFNFHPIQEVAILFAGIFATMMPALNWLELHASAFGHPSPALFYWGTGILSGVLDNAPTYLSFLKAVFGLLVDPEIVRQVQDLAAGSGAGLANLAGPHAEQVKETFALLQKYQPGQLASKRVEPDAIKVVFLLANPEYNRYLVAVSIGAVFFGANTYIGNGPNFMVKAIADHRKVHTPTFLGYLFHYTLPYMGPMLLLVWLIFFR